MDVFLHGRIIILKSELLKPGAIALWRFQSTLWTPLTAKQRCVQFDNSPTTNSHQTRLFTKNKWRLLISSRRLFHPAILSSTATTRYSCFFFPLLSVPWSPVTSALVTWYLCLGHLLLVVTRIALGTSSQPVEPSALSSRDSRWSQFKTFD